MRKLLKKVCKHCGHKFLTFDAAKAYCDIRCKELEEEPHVELPPDEARFCVICGNTFEVKSPRQVCCSQKCSREYRHRLIRY